MKEVQLVVSADVFLLKRFVNIDVKFQDVVSAYVFLPNRLVNIDVKLQDVVSDDVVLPNRFVNIAGKLQDVVSADVFCPTGLSPSMSSFKMWFLHMSFCDVKLLFLQIFSTKQVCSIQIALDYLPYFRPICPICPIRANWAVSVVLLSADFLKGQNYQPAFA
jgi:hypothetical protein